MQISTQYNKSSSIFTNLNKFNKNNKNILNTLFATYPIFS